MNFIDFLYQMIDDSLNFQIKTKIVEIYQYFIKIWPLEVVSLEMCVTYVDIHFILRRHLRFIKHNSHQISCNCVGSSTQFTKSV